MPASFFFVPDDHGQRDLGPLAGIGRRVAVKRRRRSHLKVGRRKRRRVNDRTMALAFLLHSGIWNPVSAIWNLKSGIGKRTQRNLPPIRRRQPPLVGEPPRILLQQLLGVDPIADKRAAAEILRATPS